MTTELQNRMLEDMQLQNLSPHTQASYLLQASPFARHFSVGCCITSELLTRPCGNLSALL
jgi:hypothetical protein